MCKVCRRSDIAAINRELANGTPILRISANTGIPESTLRLHKSKCVREALVAATAEIVKTSGRSVLEQIRLLQDDTNRILRAAESTGRLGTAVMAITAARQNLELLAKLTGELDERPQVNILVHPDWLGLKQTLLDALAVHPAALEAVYAALEPAATS